MIKKSILILFVVISALVIYNYEMIGYGLMQANGQLKIIFNARPIDEVLVDSTISEALKDKILLMQEIREFAIDSLGLKDSDNYTSMYDQKGKDVLWNLSAAYPYEFKSVQWSFPFLGTFSYKGFFDIERAKKERDLLKKDGFDTRIRSVSAWSTLGWFDDPILSKTLNRGEGSLADLVIHELTHSTIFLKDSLTLNENLASFIGEQGARKFLQMKYGPDSKELAEYLQADSDYRKYTDHMLSGARFLDSTYVAFSPGLTDESKSLIKREAITRIVQNIDTINFSNPDRFRGLFSKALPNNAYFLSYHRYTSKISKFEKVLNNRFKGDLVAYINDLKEQYAK